MPTGVYKRETPWWNKGKKLSKSHKLNIKEGLKNNLLVKGTNHHAWVGDDGKYSTLHGWIRKNWGQPSFCEFCGIVKPPSSKKRDWFEWAMKHGTYSRNRHDWFRLCIPCHRKYDQEVLPRRLYKLKAK